MDEIKKKIDEIVKKIKNDKDFASLFKENPIKAAESIIGSFLPEDKIKEVVVAVKTKLKLDETDIAAKLKGLFK